MDDIFERIGSRVKPFPKKVVVVSITPQQNNLFYTLWKSQMMRHLSEKDNKKVGDFSGMKASVKERTNTFSEEYMQNE